MNAIIQHNFNSGLGDCVVAITEYIETAKKIKELGYNIHLNIITNENKYYKNLKLSDLFNCEAFDIFSTINHDCEPRSEYKGFINRHISYGANIPGVHWWDLFTDNTDSLDIITFPQYNLGFNNIYSDIIKIKPATNLDIDFILQEPFIALYCRFYDFNNNIDFLINNIVTLDKIVSEADTKVFICSNSYKAKSFLINRYTNNIIFLTLPMEDSLGCHFNSNNDISQEIAKKRTELTVQEMFILSQARKIIFLTEWNRISNFLFPSYIRNVPIHSVLCQ